jgi:hypothetical protein
MANIFALSLDANYAVFGVAGVFSFPGITEQVTCTVIDHTAEMEGHAGEAHFADIDPACYVRVSELQSNGVSDYDTILNATVTFNGATWTVTKYFQVPTPFGAGELHLVLRQLQ